MNIKLFTIGFTQTSAESFFSRLTNSGAKTLLDVRLNNVSQLSGFAKSKDLAFFSKTICKINYSHQPLMAPSKVILDAYKKNSGNWDVYANRFMSLMAERKIENKFRPDQIDGACLLCSEATAHHCHRRLVYEYLKEKWQVNIDVTHL